MRRALRALSSVALIAGVAFTVPLVGVCFGRTYRVLATNHRLFGYEMGSIAYSIASGKGFASPYNIPTGPTALEPPVYPYLLAATFKLFGSYTTASAFVVLALNCLFAALTSVTVFLIGREAFGSTVGALAGWGWALYPYSLFYAVLGAWYTTLSALLLSVLFLLTLRAHRWRPPWAYFGLGLVWALAALTNAALLAFLPLSWAWIWYRGGRGGRGRNAVFGCAWAALGLMLGVAPWLVRNYLTFGRPVFIRDGFGMNLHIGNHEGAVPNEVSMHYPIVDPAELDQYRRLGELAYQREKRKEAFDFIAGHRAAFTRLTLSRVRQFWIGTWPSLPFFSFLWRPETGQRLVTFTTLALGLAGLVLAFGNYLPEALLFLALFLAHPFVYYITHTLLMYRHPIEPEMVVLAAYALASLLSWLRGASVPWAPFPIGRLFRGLPAGRGHDLARAARP